MSQTRPHPTLSLRHALIALALAVAACHRDGADIPAPVYGTTICSACGAVVDDARFAAQYRLPDGTVKSFDDPACLFDALRLEPRAPQRIRFRDYDHDAWLNADEVWFGRTPPTASHGSGWAAYKSFADAQEAVTAAGSGELLSFAQAKRGLRRSS